MRREKNGVIEPSDACRMVAFIPARGGSKSIPLKNIHKVAGFPLIYWTLAAAEACHLVDHVYVATDSPEIAEVVKRLGSARISVVDRSPETATDTASSESVLLEFAERTTCRDIIFIQATSPLLTMADLQGAIEVYREKQWDSMLSVTRQKRFIWEADQDGRARPLNYHPVSRPRRQDYDGFLVENGAFWITGKDALLTSKCRLSGQIGYWEMDPDSYLEIDEPHDILMIEALMKELPIPPLLAQNKMAGLKLLICDVDGVLTDSGMYYSEKGDELKKFNTRDGKGLQMLREAGIQTAIITGENTELVARRARKLKVDHLFQGVSDKLTVAKNLIESMGLNMSEVAFIGDDLNDSELLCEVGFSAVPADAPNQNLNLADYICKTKGGAGCVREICDHILTFRHQGASP